MARREGDGAGGVERLGLHRVVEADPDGLVIGVGGEEGVGPVPERQDGLVHAVRLQMGEDPLQHGHLGHGQQLLGRGVGEGTESRPLAAQEDDGLHFVIVVDVARGRRLGRRRGRVGDGRVEAVVAVEAGVVVAVVAVVVVDAGAVVGDGAAVDGARGRAGPVGQHGRDRARLGDRGPRRHEGDGDELAVGQLDGAGVVEDRWDCSSPGA